MVGSPLKLSRTPTSSYGAAPRVGEHTVAILESLRRIASSEAAAGE
jgi:crotonobetainyl-CoA:carnitine CoA-transferase CaiB-like acyl-CoA transferase